jgi:hypothetical protein
MSDFFREAGGEDEEDGRLLLDILLFFQLVEEVFDRF